MIKTVLFQPDIAGNVGAIIRNCVCFNSELHIIKPCGFPFDMQRVRRYSLDYIDHIKITIHESFDIFLQNEIKNNNSRLILATTKTKESYHKFIFTKDDFVIFGRESSGVTDEVFKSTTNQITIPMNKNFRSLNLAISCGILLSKAYNDFF